MLPLLRQEEAGWYGGKASRGIGSAPESGISRKLHVYIEVIALLKQQIRL
jgi:hypothetical protein